MGLAASQARFLQLTARKSNVEYQVQQINQQRASLADSMTASSTAYQEAMSNKKMVFAYNDGTGPVEVDLTYNNYKTFMNLQDGTPSTQQEIYLMSTSGNKIVVTSEEDMNKMILASYPEGSTYGESGKIVDSNGNAIETDKLEEKVKNKILTPGDFMIMDNINDPDVFQDSIQKGYLYFATRNMGDDNKYNFQVQDWQTIAGGAISEEYDKADDAEAQAKYDTTQAKIHSIDKKLELRLDELDTERNAIQTEMESISKVIDDNIESTFKVFS